MHAKAIARPAYLVAILLVSLSLALAAPATASAMQSRSASFNTSFKVTGNSAQDMVAVAKAQEERHQEDLGYTEGWCADFVSDCAKALKLGKAIPFNSMVSSLKDAVLAAGGTQVKTPAAGDLVFFGDAHVGLMTDKVNCISGNMSSPSRVRTCKVAWVVPGSKIVYVRPAYVATTYSIAFVANGGKGKMAAQKIERGKAKSLKANTFKREGYQFVGWNTKKNGKGKSYKNAQAVKNLAKAGKTVKLYAQWKKVKKRA